MKHLLLIVVGIFVLSSSSLAQNRNPSNNTYNGTPSLRFKPLFIQYQQAVIQYNKSSNKENEDLNRLSKKLIDTFAFEVSKKYGKKIGYLYFIGDNVVSFYGFFEKNNERKVPMENPTSLPQISYYLNFPEVSLPK
ncbi:hypothetical protein [Flammeovirga aprica]|uniref:DUF4359 domain-containing protein n=1 Tax=Flammeovirga aprica JL-4 TaxID=694437 RepID=A0A7X9XBB9_9BACT|nr:hypothetical protein [Flammeovirga aprica]NME70571.1 hypothetical protein [Flammeovirga aprica JL-4]